MKYSFMVYLFDVLDVNINSINWSNLDYFDLEQIKMSSKKLHVAL